MTEALAQLRAALDSKDPMTIYRATDGLTTPYRGGDHGHRHQIRDLDAGGLSLFCEADAMAEVKTGG